MKTKQRQFKMDVGDKVFGSANKPVLIVVPDGKLTYLWIGNDAPTDKTCFATVCGEKKLRKLAQNILDRLNSKRP